MENKDLNEIQNLEEKLSQKITEEKEGLTAAEKNKKNRENTRKKILTSLKIILLFGLFFYNYRKLPEAIDSLKPLKPLRFGTYATDQMADDCIKKLWKIGGGEKAGLRCPLSGEAYVKEKDGFCCPNPEKHGLKSLCFDLKEKRVVVLEK